MAPVVINDGVQNWCKFPVPGQYLFKFFSSLEKWGPWCFVTSCAWWHKHLQNEGAGVPNTPLLCSWSSLAFSFQSISPSPFLLCAVVLWPSTAVLRASATVQPCVQQREGSHTRSESTAQPGKRQQQQQMMATELACPKGAFHAREAQKPFLRLLHVLGLHLLCLSALFSPHFSSLCYLLCTQQLTWSPQQLHICWEFFQRSWLKAAGSNTAGTTEHKTWRTLQV